MSTSSLLLVGQHHPSTPELVGMSSYVPDFRASSDAPDSHNPFPLEET